MKKQKQVRKQDGTRVVAIMIVALVFVVLLVSLIVGMGAMKNEQYSDDYFVSDGSKLVLSLDKATTSFVNEDSEPDVTHIVYYYSGGNIREVKIFFAYNDGDEAKTADEKIGEDYKEWAVSKEVNGKYLIFEVDQETLEGVTTEEIRDNIENMKAAGLAL